MFFIHKYFTLIELLIVIAVIAILASLLFPALARAKDMAHRTVCMGNMRNLALMMHNYADDNDEIHFIYSYYYDDPYGYRMTAAHSYNSPALRLGGQLDCFGRMFPAYWTNAELYYCPGAAKLDKTPKSLPSNWRTATDVKPYCYWWPSYRFVPSEFPGLRRGVWGKPNVPLFGDMYYSNHGGQIAHRGRGYNFVFGDLHARWIDEHVNQYWATLVDGARMRYGNGSRPGIIAWIGNRWQ